MEESQPKTGVYTVKLTVQGRIDPQHLEGVFNSEVQVIKVHKEHSFSNLPINILDSEVFPRRTEPSHDDPPSFDDEGNIQRREECTWTWNHAHYMWVTECGTGFQFHNGGPEENGFNACPFCSGELTVRRD